MKKLVAILGVCALAGCAAPPAKLDMPFDEPLARQLMAPGTNTIKGSALLRQQGGGVVTCAGNEVHLIPATEYAKKRMAMIYGSRSLSRGLNFESTPAGYLELSRKTACNAQGFFTFENVADGEFFVATRVIWTVGYAPQGGNLANRVNVAGGQAKEIVLTDGCLGCN